MSLRWNAWMFGTWQWRGPLPPLGLLPLHGSGTAPCGHRSVVAIRDVYLPSKCLYSMDLGDLYDSLSGKGFSARQKRLAASNNVDVSS
ncbi:SWR1 complex subunit 2-like [Pyrus ussuriensis x Pyrus communis]|uniref:SWR1 complex subunit 2-like n=1 Tax=Pyrus ussuriensis x Pyrus communis TaxID=2448454 RepID=A0A5N5FC97_9ROSA|nr:SWR1 complex subunit 2-like [Pyrus ussuriensis x Pyrus communis]